MIEPSGLYSTMIQKVNIPSGMFLEELGKIGPYYKYISFPIELMEYQKEFLKRVEEEVAKPCLRKP